MGCSSCQQNNHVVPTQTTHNHTTTYCDCACGCSEPVCPTPQPCTEITDSKCIVYTDLPITCGNVTVVTANASVSTALNQIVSYFCGQIVPLVTEDVICDEEIIVPANSTLEEAVIALLEWVCSINNLTNDLTETIQQIQEQIESLTECCQENTQTNLVQDEQIAALEQCCTDNTETNELQNVQLEDQASQIGVLQAAVSAITPHYKYVHETTSVFDGDSVQISRIDLEDCSLIPPACSTDPFFVDKVCDLHVSVYYFFTGTWIKIPTYVSGAEGYQLAIDATTGVLTIIFAIPPVSPAVPVRVVVLA